MIDVTWVLVFDGVAVLLWTYSLTHHSRPLSTLPCPRGSWYGSAPPPCHWHVPVWHNESHSLPLYASRSTITNVWCVTGILLITPGSIVCSLELKQAFQMVVNVHSRASALSNDLQKAITPTTQGGCSRDNFHGNDMLLNWGKMFKYTVYIPLVHLWRSMHGPSQVSVQWLPLSHIYW